MQLGTLVLVELKGQHIETTTLNTLTAARALGNDITVLVAGDGVQKVAEAAASLGVKKVGVQQSHALHGVQAPASCLTAPACLPACAHAGPAGPARCPQAPAC